MSTILPCTRCDREKYFEGLCWRCQSLESNDRVLALTEEELQREIEEIARNIESDSYAYERFLQLFSLRAIDTQIIAKAALEHNVYFPPELYTHASANVRDTLIHRLTATKDSHEANHLQSCLAMIGDAAVLDIFHHLEHHPLPWREKLHVDPSMYAEKGGWSFTNEGEKYSLAFDDCYCLVEGQTPADDAIQVGRLRTEQCEHCNCPLVDMLQIDGRDKRLHFLGIDGTARITVCPNCVSLAEVVFCRYEVDGASTILDFEDAEEGNHFESEDLALMNANSLALAKQRVNPFFGVADGLHNTIGGHANWVQDWVHHICPDCGKKMTYFAQIHWDTLMESMEGTLYFELCSPCQVVAMFHQQT